MSYLDIYILGQIASLLVFSFFFIQSSEKYHTPGIFFATLVFMIMFSWVGFMLMLGDINQARKKSKSKKNKKIIQELEHKLSIVLDYATDGEITKPNTDMIYIREEMNKKILREWKNAIQDYREAIGDIESKDRPKAPSEQETKST